MRALYSGKKGVGGSRGRDVYAIINLSASISTPETFLNTKAKCPLDVSEAASLPLGWDLEEFFFKYFIFFQKKNSPFIPPSGSRPTTDYKNLSHNKVSPTEKEEKKIRSVVYIKM